VRAAPRVCEQLLRSGRVGIELLLGQAEAHPERDETSLRAVVQVSLDPAKLGLLLVDGSRAGRLEHGDALLIAPGESHREMHCEDRAQPDARPQGPEVPRDVTAQMSTRTTIAAETPAHGEAAGQPLPPDEIRPLVDETLACARRGRRRRESASTGQKRPRVVPAQMTTSTRFRMPKVAAWSASERRRRVRSTAGGRDGSFASVAGEQARDEERRVRRAGARARARAPALRCRPERTRASGRACRHATSRSRCPTSGRDRQSNGTAPAATSVNSCDRERPAEDEALKEERLLSPERVVLQDVPASAEAGGTGE
jgi:hypothetical protein